MCFFHISPMRENFKKKGEKMVFWFNRFKFNHFNRISKVQVFTILNNCPQPEGQAELDRGGVGASDGGVG